MGGVFDHDRNDTGWRGAYSFFHDLRTRDNLKYVVPETSRVIEIPDEELRLLHLSHLMLTTIPGASGFGPFGPIRTPISPISLTWSAASFMGMIHFNQRNGTLIPGLSERLEGCDLYLTMDMLDAQISPIVASRQILKAMSRNHSLATPRPGTVVGGSASDATLPVSLLVTADKIPQVSGISSAAIFDEKDQYPTFARTVPTTKGHAAAMIELLKHLNVFHVGWVYLRTEYGQTMFSFFQQMAIVEGITIASAHFESATDADSVRRACEAMKESGYRYIITVGNPTDIGFVLEQAYAIGIAGPGFQWITASAAITDHPFDATRTDLIPAFNGLLSVENRFIFNPQFLDIMHDFLHDPELNVFFVKSHPESFIFDNFAFNESAPILTPFAYTLYDAMITVGISACEAKSRTFTGSEHYDQVKNTTFPGISGDVRLDSVTGTRMIENLNYAFHSFHIDYDKSTDEIVVFTAENSVTVDFALDDPIILNSPLIFADNTTTSPLSLPIVDGMDENLIPRRLRIFGWILAGVIFIMSIYFALFTFQKRKRVLIRASQPTFLGMLCVGTIFMASAIIPLSLQEPISQEGLDIACMAVPWLFTIGFSTAFSALFTKAWRVNKLFQNAVDMQKVQIHPRDVIWPFVLLTITNVAILTTWTIVSPLQWIRTFTASVDHYDRHLGSYGSCDYSIDGSGAVFVLLLAVFNFLAVLFANYQSYVGRNNPSDFNESSYVALSMASLLECFLIGGPILVLVGESPKANFGIKSILIFVMCCAILLPMYIPKFTAARTNARLDMSDLRRSMRVRSRKSSTAGDFGLDSSRNNSCSQARIEYLRSRAILAINDSVDAPLPSSVDELRRNARRTSLVLGSPIPTQE